MALRRYLFTALALQLACVDVLLAEKAPRVWKSWVYKNPRFVHDEGGSTIESTPLDYTHMGMLSRLPSGEIVATWQGSLKFWEGSGKQGIYAASSFDGGLTWTSPRLVIRPIGTPVWAPVTHVEGNRTWLLYAESRPQCWWWGEGGLHWACGGDIKITYSDNNNDLWIAPQVVLSFNTDGGIAKMLANKISIGLQGEWLLPFWREMGGQNCMQAPNMHGKAGVLISEDKGVSWRSVEVELEGASPSTWLIEASITEVRSGNQSSFLQFFRSQVGTIYMSTSPDGLTWSPANATVLPNPNSKIDSVMLRDGSVLMAFNDNAAARSPLTLARSFDEGVTWERLVVLENDPVGQFSYPTLLYDERTDLAQVIYTVLYPPTNNAWNLLMGKAFRLAGRVRGSARKLLGGISPLSTAVQHSMGGASNAWGYNAFGLRIASVPNISEIKGQ